MFGFKFCENFNYPYISRSIQEFWRRWHISLSTWFRDYLYIPLGGNRSSALRTYVNLWTVFILCGLWHGASWNFLIWGVFHGFFLVLERGGWGRVLQSLPSAASHVYTMFTVMIGWTIFRAEDLSQAKVFLAAMFGAAQGHPTPLSFSYYMGPDIVTATLLGILFSTPLWSWLLNKMKQPVIPTLVNNVALICLLVLSVASVASSTYNPFLYFRF